MPYTSTNYPAQLKNLPAGARELWIRTFNAVLESTHNENSARQAAWSNVKNKYKKVGNKWVKKSINFIIDLFKKETMVLQTLIFDKNKFSSKDDAINWATNHGFKHDSIRETGSSYRLRQVSKNDFIPNTYRTKNMSDGVTAVYGKLKVNNKKSFNYEDEMKIKTDNIIIKKNGVTEITNNSEDQGIFKAFIPLVKKNGSYIIKKSEGEGMPENYFLVGEASNTKVDKADDRMSKNFVRSMKAQIQGLNVFAEHEYDIEKTLGYVSATDGNDDMVIVETALENPAENSLVDKIIKKIAHGTKIYYSVAGKITKACKKIDESLNKTVREIEDGIIYEVSLTALPEGDVGFVSPIMKSFKTFMKAIDSKDDDNDLDEDEENEDEDEDEELEDEETDINKNASNLENFSKALQEMMQSHDISDKIYTLFYTFREAMYQVTNDENLKPAEKKEKIMNLASEYGTEVENLSNQLAELTETINQQLSSESSSTE